ncbi:hypothetical protein ACFO26_01690 [Lactococcus nasutitermitis]|uniref:Uncharacterized protein n=1 Tax=Lactococcus nasutitermitis TaxID=1652957 RepID=A0ABV9JBH6_9LACT|nr:hypothetical protein [Lactococcus nasutitermitis]
MKFNKSLLALDFLLFSGFGLLGTCYSIYALIVSLTYGETDVIPNELIMLGICAVIMIGCWLLFKRQHRKNKMNAPKKDTPEEEKKKYGL